MLRTSMNELNTSSSRQRYRMASLFLVALVYGMSACLFHREVLAESQWLSGAAKLEITPTEPVRLSGYAVRERVMNGVDDPLFVRALAMRPIDGEWMVLVSIDSIGLPAEITDRILEKLGRLHQLERKQVVLCATHSHTTPHLIGMLENLFAEPLNGAELEACKRYSDGLVDKVIDAVTEAMRQAEPCTLGLAESRFDMAVNRRQPLPSGLPGPVDPSVRLMQLTRRDGTPLAIVFQYACHCTTITPEVNRVSADWAGLAASQLERVRPRCVAMPIIGCGADAKPKKKGSHEVAVQLGKELAQIIDEGLKGLKPLSGKPQMRFSYVALAFERPKKDRLEAMQESQKPQERFFARSMLDVWKRKGRIPETYPAPIHLWTFGTSLTWVFLGGEVVSDYQERLKRELGDQEKVWVAAYADDVFSYVASERMRNEGGYEVDGSMLYYNRPGRLESGTEEVIIRRILDLQRTDREIDRPLTPRESHSTVTSAPGYRVELIAHEPLIQDPINVAFDAKGRAWVVEMGDYPFGDKGRGGSNDWKIETTMDSMRQRPYFWMTFPFQQVFFHGEMEWLSRVRRTYSWQSTRMTTAKQTNARSW